MREHGIKNMWEFQGRGQFKKKWNFHMDDGLGF